MAVLGLEAASTGAGIVAPGPSEHFHDLVGVPTLAKQPGHETHGSVYVVEECLVSGAKIVEAPLPVGIATNRFFGHSPLQANRTSHRRQ